MAVRNIARGGGKAFKPQIVGLKDLERKLKALRADNPRLQDDMYAVVGSVADDLRDEMRSAAISKWSGQRLVHRKGIVTGEDAADSIFSFSKPRTYQRQSRYRISALGGVGKRRTMVEWIAGKYPKSPRAKVKPGNPVSMSFAAMLEFGTSNRKARPAIRSVLLAAKSKVITKLADGYRALIEKYSK